MQNNSLQHIRFFISLLFAFILIYGDINIAFFSQIRSTLSVVITPFRFVANLPENSYKTTSDYLRSRSDLLKEIDSLKSKITIDEARLKSFDFYEHQNKDLRNLLQITTLQRGKWIAVGVERNISQPLASKLYLDKGTLQDVVPGQAVVDELGIIGQVIRVDANTSVVNFITDINQWMSARIRRNNQLVILRGNGHDKLLLQYASNNVDIQVGDELLVEGGHFPTGYPIGQISAIEEGAIYIDAEVTPYSKFQNNTAVMLYVVDQTEESNEVQ